MPSSLGSSPRTPKQNRKTSGVGLELSFSSPNPRNDYSRRPSISSRRSSTYSVTPSCPISSQGRTDSFRATNGFGHGQESESVNGIGNLADELAEVEDEEDEGDFIGEDRRLYDDEVIEEQDYTTKIKSGHSISRNAKNAMFVPANLQSCEECSASPPEQPTCSKHRRPNSDYDGSSYGDDNDLRTTGSISSSLESCMAVFESLARRGTETYGSIHNNAINRVAGSLRDLTSQADVENGASRLITAYTALNRHLSNQTRHLQTICHPILSPISTPPDSEFVGEIVPLLTELIASMPVPAPQPLSSLHSLHTSTIDLISVLTYLSDTLQMTRRSTSLASRRLRSATELVVEMRREAEAGEEAERWLEKGKWNERLAGRECATICEDVIGGFERECARWREQLIQGVAVGAA